MGLLASWFLVGFLKVVVVSWFGLVAVGGGLLYFCCASYCELVFVDFLIACLVWLVFVVIDLAACRICMLGCLVGFAGGVSWCCLLVVILVVVYGCWRLWFDCGWWRCWLGWLGCLWSCLLTFRCLDAD